jgi:hypothetical protein
MCAARQYCAEQYCLHSNAGHGLHVDVMHEHKRVMRSKGGQLLLTMT